MSRPFTKLYVAKFSNVGKKDIEDTFGKYGELYSCKVNDREGYATVSYKYQDQAERAIQKLNGSDAFGGNLLVEHTHKKSRDDDYSRPPRDGRFNGNSSGGFRDQNAGSYRGGPSGSSRYGDRSGGDRTGERSGERYGERRGDRDGGSNYRRGTSGPPRLDKDKYFKEGLCFTCGGHGHISKKCPEARYGGGRDNRDPRGGRGAPGGFKGRRPYRERSRSYDRSKGRSRREESRSKSPYDKYADKDRKRRSRKHSRRSSSSSSSNKSGESKERKERKRSASSSSQSSRTNSNSSRSNSASHQNQSNGDRHQNMNNGNPGEQNKDIVPTQ